MSEFTPIETQEQFNSIISDRISRAKEATRKEYEGFMSPDEIAIKTDELNSTINDLKDKLTNSLEVEKTLQADIAAKNDALKKAELKATKASIIQKWGLTSEAAEFLSGEDEETLNANAEKLKNITTKKISGMPMASGEHEITENGKRTANYRQMLNNMKGNN